MRTFFAMNSALVVGPYVFRRAAQDEQIGQAVDNVEGIERAFDTDDQGLLPDLVDNVQSAIVGGPIQWGHTNSMSDI